MSSTQTEEKIQEHYEDSSHPDDNASDHEVEDGGQQREHPTKQQPLKKKPVQQLRKKQQQPQPSTERTVGNAGDGGGRVLGNTMEKTKELPADDELQQMTLPAGKHDLIKDVAMQPLRGRKEMISQTIGEGAMKEIEDAREKDKDEKQSLRIKISLDLDVEVHLSARVKGDITIGLL